MYSLTNRELEVLNLVKKGKSNSQIADELIVSRNTAKAHVANILYKMDVNDRICAVVKAIKENIIEL